MPNLIIAHTKPRRSTWQLMRATIRDWWVLLREFRWPLVLYLFTSEIVAALFWLYYTHPNHPRGLLLDEAFYAVLTLTVMEAAFPIPEGPGHWLIVFFFLMPFVGLILASQGLANFLALLFNRRARGAAWQEAIASTYSRHTVVCGLGHVGSRVVENLLSAGCQVVGVEQEAGIDSLARLRALGVTVIEGDIRHREVLRQAGIAKAQAAVICTNNDLANLEAALNCRELNPTIRLVVRLFDAELARRVKTVFHIDEAYSASALAAPIFAAAALQVEGERTFSIGDDILNIGRLSVKPDSRLVGQTVGIIENNFDCSIIAHTRNGHKDIHPPHTLTLLPGDYLMILADLATLNRLTQWNHGRRF